MRRNLSKLALFCKEKFASGEKAFLASPLFKAACSYAAKIFPRYPLFKEGSEERREIECTARCITSCEC